MSARSQVRGSRSDPVDPGAAPDAKLQSALRDQLLALSYHAFEQVVRELLNRLGYSDARLLGRTQWRQYTRHGGIDMEAYARVGLTNARVVLQIKQYRRPVSRRFVDELCGVMQRMGAREGIVITTSQFSRVAVRAAQSHRACPIRLIDGEELIGLLIKHRIGMGHEEATEGTSIPRIDVAFFNYLRAQYPKTTVYGSAATHGAEPKLLTPAQTLPRLDSLNLTPMLWRTHILGGICSLWLLTCLPGALTTQTIPLSAGMAAFGSLLPDLDAVESKVKHLGALGITPFAPISLLANRAFGHRGLLHSPVALIPVAVLSAVFAFWIGVVPGISLLLGYGSHLALDALTHSGISALPFSKRRLHLPPPGLRLVTGSIQEDLLMLLLGFLAVLLLLHFLPFSPFHP